jgi:hypothetical protein
LPYCIKCARPFEGQHCPLCGGFPALSSKQIDKSLNPYMAVLVVGLGACMLGVPFWGLVDAYPPLVAGWIIFAVPILTHVILSAGERRPPNSAVVKAVFRLSAVLMIALPVLLFANRAFDRSPARRVYTVVTLKSFSSGRGSTDFLTVAPSWRPERTQEQLIVSGPTFSSVYKGEPVAITVHKGLFGLSWYDHVVPR